MFVLKYPTEFVTCTKVVRQGLNGSVSSLFRGRLKSLSLKTHALSPQLFKELSVGPVQVLTSDFALGRPLLTPFS